MNENLAIWMGLLFWMVYRTVWQCRCTERCLKYLLSRYRHWLDPVIVGVIGLFVFQARSCYDIVKYDVIAYKWLDSPVIHQNLVAAPANATTLLRNYNMPRCLKIAALVGPVLGTIAFLVVFCQTLRYMKISHMKARRMYHTQRSLEDSCILSVICMPAFFIAMNSRALIRIIGVMTGSSWMNYKKANPDTLAEYEKLRILDLGLYQMDLELGAAFQYATVFAFALLCGRAVKNSTHAVPNAWRRTMTRAGIQGIYAYVFVGVARSAANFFLQLSESFLKREVTEQEVDVLQSSVLEKLSSMFLLVTILCILNMIELGKMPEINEMIPKASIKFLATRFLLLVTQAQPQVLGALQTSKPLVVQLKAHFPNVAIIQNWELSEDQVKLWNASLLGLECLLVVLFNFFCWRGETVDTIQAYAWTLEGENAYTPNPKWLLGDVKAGHLLTRGQVLALKRASCCRNELKRALNGADGAGAKIIQVTKLEELDKTKEMLEAQITKAADEKDYKHAAKCQQQIKHIEGEKRRIQPLYEAKIGKANDSSASALERPLLGEAENAISV